MAILSQPFFKILGHWSWSCFPHVPEAKFWWNHESSIKCFSKSVISSQIEKLQIARSKSQKCRLKILENSRWPIQFRIAPECMWTKNTGKTSWQNFPPSNWLLSLQRQYSSVARGYPYASPPAVASPDAKRLLLATSPKACPSVDGWKVK